MSAHMPSKSLPVRTPAVRWAVLAALSMAGSAFAGTLLERLHLSRPTPPFTALSDLALLSQPKPLPRNINLNAFNPRREPSAFSCRQAAQRPLPESPALQALHEEGLALTSPALWPNQRNWPRALQLWRQAADQGHWKAALMWLQTSYTGAGVQGPNGDFRVPPAPQETVVAYTEQLMRQGVADAFFWMGEFHKQGYGVKFSADRAWAFWELAADLGSAKAQTQIATVLGLGFKDMEPDHPGQWANIPLRYALLRCCAAPMPRAMGRQALSWGVIWIQMLGVGICLPPTQTCPPSSAPRCKSCMTPPKTGVRMRLERCLWPSRQAKHLPMGT
ncbi:hypothetical protein ACG0Z6_16495 [Roseateles sp. BYS180W]|uniref:Sel1 repeat family protein n=1 Tax=Roseateles rivi TaxID=3299028 RepID=A0ABW7FZT6_9BURK